MHSRMLAFSLKEKRLYKLFWCSFADWPQGGRSAPVNVCAAQRNAPRRLHEPRQPLWPLLLLFQIEAATRNHGPKTGARELLGRIVRGRPGWFSKFLSILLETGHKDLYSELTGGYPDCDKQGD